MPGCTRRAGSSPSSPSETGSRSTSMTRSARSSSASCSAPRLRRRCSSAIRRRRASRLRSCRRSRRRRSTSCARSCSSSVRPTSNGTACAARCASTSTCCAGCNSARSTSTSTTPFPATLYVTATCCASHRRRCRTRCAPRTQSTSSCACTPTTDASCSRWRTTASASSRAVPACGRGGSASPRWKSVRSVSAVSSRFAPLPVQARRCAWRSALADPIRVLVVDDHAVVRAGLRAFLDLQEGIEVAGEAADGEEALAEADRLRPDVVLMDLVMPRLDGVRALRALRERLPDARVIVLTSFLDDDKLLPALRAGAAGYLLKNAEPRELVRAVRVAHAGEALLDPVVAARLVESLAAGEQDEPLDRLTPREREVLVLIGHGFPNKQIAQRLDVSEKTVKTHVGRLLAKLCVDDRTQAAVLAVRAGLVGPRS